MLDFNFLKNYNLSENDVRTLSSQIDSRIKRHVELETNWVKNPFELKDDMCIMQKSRLLTVCSTTQC